MPRPGSHRYDIQRTRRRADAEARGIPDRHADRAANEELQRDNPPVAVPPRPGESLDRAAGPRGTGGTSRGDPSIDEPGPEPSGGMELRSAAFNDHTLIPERFSADGGNVSPPLEWNAVPDGAVEIALLCEDPDAPTGVFTHWIVAGISPQLTALDEGALPDGVTVGRNDFGELGWGGPRPPVGDEAHRYFFRLYAADRPLQLDEGCTAADLRDALDGNELATGTLVGLFQR